MTSNEHVRVACEAVVRYLARVEPILERAHPPAPVPAPLIWWGRHLTTEGVEYMAATKFDPLQYYLYVIRGLSPTDPVPEDVSVAHFYAVLRRAMVKTPWVAHYWKGWTPPEVVAFRLELELQQMEQTRRIEGERAKEEALACGNEAFLLALADLNNPDFGWEDLVKRVEGWTSS